MLICVDKFSFCYFGNNQVKKKYNRYFVGSYNVLLYYSF